MKEPEQKGIDFPIKKNPEKGFCCVRFCKRKASSESHSMCSTHSMQDWRARFPIRDRYTRLKARAKRRGVPFYIQYGNFVRFCLETGYHNNSGRFSGEIHLDRIKAFINGRHAPYAIWNVRPLECSENSHKGAYLDKIMKRHSSTQEMDLGDNEPF